MHGPVAADQPQAAREKRAQFIRSFSKTGRGEQKRIAVGIKGQGGPAGRVHRVLKEVGGKEDVGGWWVTRWSALPSTVRV